MVGDKAILQLVSVRKIDQVCRDNSGPDSPDAFSIQTLIAALQCHCTVWNVVSGDGAEILHVKSQHRNIKQVSDFFIKSIKNASQE